MGLFEWLNNEELGIIGKWLNYEDTGQWGEYLTEYLIKGYIEGYYKIVKNIYLNTKNATTEIDVILLHEKGIFVFESKNYSGWIFGNIEQKYWTQCLANKEKKRFYNPILQNKTHIKALINNLCIDENVIFSYIIFSERCELKSIPESTEKTTIIKRNELRKKLDKHINNLNVHFSREEIDKLERIMKEKSNISQEEKDNHIKSIENIKNNEVCPFCKNKLVLRKGKFGDFYGCSSYPKCKYTKKVLQE